MTEQPKQMTPREIVAARDALTKLIGGRAEVYISVSPHRAIDKPLSATVYLDGVCGSDDRRFAAEAAQWGELFDALRGVWRDYESKYTAETIRRMALEIIRATADRGCCTESDLRMANFTGDQISGFTERAIADADAIAANGPFSVVRKSGNGG